MSYNVDQRKPDRRPTRERNLVSDQPGFFILFLGLFFAVIVGASIRTATQSDWFHDKLKEAIANVGKDWRIEHGAVELYLKDGLRPAIGVSIADVKIASESRCFMKSGGFAQKIKIPLSLINYFVDGQLVSEIDIEGFKIAITEPYTPGSNHCSAEEAVVELPSKGEIKRKNQITIVDKVERSQMKNEIQLIRINKLEIYYPHEKYDYVLMKDIVITNKSVHPKILLFEGNVDLKPILKTGESKAMASLKIEYNEFPEKIIKSNLLGSLREGFFSLQLVNRLDDDRFQLQSELKNVSLSLLKGFIDEIPKDLNLKSNWLSAKLYSEGSSRTVGSSSIQLKEMLVNGDLGEISVETLQFPNGFLKGPNDFEVKMRGLNLSKIVELVPTIIVPKQIESLGVLDGEVRVSNNSSVILNGRLSSVELVFSANGVRKTEKLTVEKIVGGWKKNNSSARLTIESDELRIDNRSLDGFFRFKSDDMRHFNLETHLRNVQLSPSVSELVTGSETPFVFDDVTIKASGNKELVHYKVAGKIKSFFHQYLDAFNLAFSISGSANEGQEIEIKADQLQFTDEMQKVLTRFDIAIPLLNNKPKLKLSQGNRIWQIKYDTASTLRATATVNEAANDRLTDTANDNRGILKSVNGFITTKDHEWKIYGTRDNIKIDKK